MSNAERRLKNAELRIRIVQCTRYEGKCEVRNTKYGMKVNIEFRMLIEEC